MIQALFRKAGRRWGQWLAFAGGGVLALHLAVDSPANSLGLGIAIASCFGCGLGLRALALWREGSTR